ncbi:hypothetical protein [Gemmatimonas sp.]|uniref:hypothetical protein n=1 Tax=Gemmatimonas sp. TaxID=1962908 RepID=UPI00398373FA
MRLMFGLTAAVALAGSGGVAGRARPVAVASPVATVAPVADEHANHETSSMLVGVGSMMPGTTFAQQPGGISASAAAAGVRSGSRRRSDRLRRRLARAF